MLKKNNEKGVSLIETLIAIVLLSVLLLGTGGLLIGTIHGNTVSKDVTMATLLAQEKIEEIKALGYSNISPVDITFLENFGDISGYPNNKRVIDIFVNTPEAGMKTVVVESSCLTISAPVVLNAIIVR